MKTSKKPERTELPSVDDLLWPTLRALEYRGGSASIAEIVEWIAEELRLSDSMLDIPHGDGPRSELAYRAAWARTELKNIGAVANSSRGIWTITKIGRNIGADDQVRELFTQMRKERYSKTGQPERSKAKRKADRVSEDDKWSDDDWKERLLKIVLEISPDAFEHLCQRILREAGFISVEVTGRSGDGGIDGAGVLRLNLLSFHVRFQCKRYSGSVGAREIRDFRGGLVGRADKGLFMTTGHFTPEASREAVRDGATAIDLVDGYHLCDLLKQYGLGTSVEAVERVQIDEKFFENF